MKKRDDSFAYLFHWTRRNRLRQWWRAGHDSLRNDNWFPHWPLALAVAVLGVLNLSPLMALAGLSAPSRAWAAFLRSSALHGLPQAITGLILVAMALGLLLRSRLSWAVAVVVAAASLAITLHGHLQTSAWAAFNGLTLLALLIFQRHFDRSSLAAGTLFAAISVLLLIGYAVFGALVLGGGFSPPITTLSTALYFAVETMSTVGYGDITPKTIDARFFVISIIILGITVFATSISAIIVPAVTGRMQRLMKGEKQTMQRKNHYVIIGDTPLARNTCRELLQRHLPVTVVMAANNPAVDFEGADIVVGDPSDLDVLRLAGVPDAVAVLALWADDSENAFAVLSVKELGGSARTVAAVNHSRNMARVRSVHPDMVIAPQVMGGELLAMALNGERLDNEDVMARLFHSNDHP
ncbi:MAG: voltage-gated potassium channel protein [Gammaproteobacteria bacterium]|nr:voltage-gated potassium channel protein [Gammaproteobacteria bacterium]